MRAGLGKKAAYYLQQLCVEIGERCVGSSGNQRAAEFFATLVADFGFDIEMQEFPCFDWSQAGATLEAGGNVFQVLASPYSRGCRVKAPLCTASSIDELQGVDGAEKIILLRGELAKEQLMPKNFTFYNPEKHKKIIRLLETGGFKAVTAATSYNPESAGGVYPFPLIEDGDFNLPSVYMTEGEGEKLAACKGDMASLEVNAVRVPSRGCNVVACKGNDSGQKISILAHIDSKQGTPGAVDNAGGTVVLLLLAELLREYNGDLKVEIVALNGEDYYSNPGQMLYLQENAGKFPEIALGINIDGVGLYEGKTAFSLYDCPGGMGEAIRRAFSFREDMVEGSPWYQGDHGLFILNRRPALALTSENMEKLLEIAHTPGDHIGVVDHQKLVDTAEILSQLLLDLNRRLL